jgi:hypothetical protein
MSGPGGEFFIDGNLISAEYVEKPHGVRMPTLIIAGEDDAISLGMSREMQSKIPGRVWRFCPKADT